MKDTKNLIAVTLIDNLNVEKIYIYDRYCSSILGILNKLYPGINIVKVSDNLFYINITNDFTTNNIKTSIKFLIKELKINDVKSYNMFKKIDKICIYALEKNFFFTINIDNYKQFIAFTRRYFKLSKEKSYNLYKYGLQHKEIELTFSFLDNDTLNILKRLLNKNTNDIIMDQYWAFFEAWVNFDKERIAN